jgi:hypothetical protein
MSVQVLKSVTIHKTVVLRLVASRAAGGGGFANYLVDFPRLLADKHTKTSVLLVASQICFGVKVLNAACQEHLSRRRNALS